MRNDTQKNLQICVILIIIDVIPDSSDEQRQIAAIKIQALFRGHKEHVKYLQERKKIVKVEAVARGYLARKHVAELKGYAKITQVC